MGPMRRWIAACFLLAACSEDHLPGFATGEPSYGQDAAAGRAIDAGAPLDGALDASDASPDARD